MAVLLDGKSLAKRIESELAKKISALSSKPSLRVVFVGDNPASATYVGAKKKAAERVGIDSEILSFPSSIGQKELLLQIDKLNKDPSIDGILVQLPLPPGIDPGRVAMHIEAKKDVDGIHPLNLGKLLSGIETGLKPCTPLAIQALLMNAKIPIEGKRVVILGRSNIVGKPLAAMLMQKKQGANATVIVAHSLSENLPLITKEADILIAALGRPKWVGKEIVKENAVVIDVGIHRVGPKQLIGDVDFEEVSLIASHITPVPGGVGPMTIAMLLKNTYQAFCQKT